jgi:hypothetical protein
MFTSFTRRTRPGASARLRRLIAALTVAAGGMLAWAAVPAASAATIPVPGPAGAYGPVTPGITVRTITVGGMPGWQITLIAIAAALAAAATAVLLDRTRATRRSVSAIR